MIKFRVWCNKLKQWEKCKFMIDDNGNIFGIFSERCFALRNDTHILMQSTGLEDKNGKEVYEGDIVHYYDCMTETNGIGYIDFSDASFRINGFIKAYRWMDYEIEVLGNIYENPDLLEVEDCDEKEEQG